MMPSSQSLTLRICTIIVLVGVVVLLIDYFVVRRHQRPRRVQLARICHEFSLTPAGQRSKQQLCDILRTLDRDASVIDTLDSVLTRSDEYHTLWLFEYQQRGLAFHRSTRPDLTIDATLFGIVIELNQSEELTKWQQSVPASELLATELPRQLNVASISHLERLPSYRMAMADHCVFLTTSSDGWALVQAMEQSTSAEFHPGLFNSAMKIDVQTAVQMVNHLDTGSPDLASFYQVAVPKPAVAVSKPTGIQSRLKAIQKETMEKLDAIRGENASPGNGDRDDPAK